VNNIRSKICLAENSFGLEEKVVSIYTTIGCHNTEEEERSLKIYKFIRRHADGGWMDARARWELCNTRQAMYV